MSIFLFLLQNLPAILQAIVGIERLVVETRMEVSGATKKAMVMSSVIVAAKGGDSIPASHLAAVGALIDSVVGDLNAAGLLPRATSTAATPALTVMAALGSKSA